MDEVAGSIQGVEPAGNGRQPERMGTGWFANALLAWFDRHGRRDLPWQHNPTPYRVWVSEIMLQQTQVAVVIPYFERFMARFPTLADLAAASQDEVLHLWSGLGYYARARNLRRAARVMVADHGGEVPRDLTQVMALPGIGRSTAGAILSLALGERHPILDGNVKRVLARGFAVPGWPGRAAALARLWALAEAYTPRERVADYNQAIMDLGATLCTRAQPLCAPCPLAERCAALAAGAPTAFPESRPRKTLPVREARLLVVRGPAGEVLLERRPPTGVWAGLWSLPECRPEMEPADWCRARLGASPRRVEKLAVRRHTFSHFHLDIAPLRVDLGIEPAAVADGDALIWYLPQRPTVIGLPAPIAGILREIAGKHTHEPGETP